MKKRVSSEISGLSSIHVQDIQDRSLWTMQLQIATVIVMARYRLLCRLTEYRGVFERTFTKISVGSTRKLFVTGTLKEKP